MLKFLEQLQLCYELTEREVQHYGQRGYLFSSLRPSAGTYLPKCGCSMHFCRPATVAS
jgi:hypothetical protein